MRKAMRVLKEATSEQRDRVREALQESLGDGDKLLIEYRMKQKNRPLNTKKQNRKAPTRRMTAASVGRTSNRNSGNAHGRAAT